MTVSGETAAGAPVVAKQWGEGGSATLPMVAILPARMAKVSIVHLSSGGPTGTVRAGDGTALLSDNTACIDLFTGSRTRFSGCVFDDDRWIAAGGLIKTHTRPAKDLDCLEEYPGMMDLSGGLYSVATALNQSGASNTTFLGYTTAARTAGQNTLPVSGLTRFPSASYSQAPTLGVDYICRVEYDHASGVNFRTKGTFTGQFTSASLFTFNSGTLAFNVASTRRLSFRLVAAAWDGLRVKEQYGNPAHPLYYFRNPKGPERPDWLTHYFIDCSIGFGLRVLGGTGNSSVFSADANRTSWVEWGPQGWRISLPKPPYNDTQSPPRWAYDATFSDVSEPLMGDGLPAWGRNGSRNDHSWENTIVIARTGLYKRPGSHGMESFASLTASPNSSQQYQEFPPFPDYRWLKTDGTVDQATEGDTRFWPNRGGTEIVGNHTMNATSIQTAGLPVGTIVGDTVQIWLRPFKPGRAKLLQVPIATLPGGNVFTIAAPGLPHNILKRSEVTIIPAHTAPVDDWFMTLDQFALR